MRQPLGKMSKTLRLRFALACQPCGTPPSTLGTYRGAMPWSTLNPPQRLFLWQIINLVQQLADLRNDLIYHFPRMGHLSFNSRQLFSKL